VFILEGFYTNQDDEDDSEPPKDTAITEELYSPDQLQETTLAILLQAMSGIPAAHTIRVNGTIAGHSVHILVDSGSTHNFINDQLADKLNLEISTADSF